MRTLRSLVSRLVKTAATNTFGSAAYAATRRRCFVAAIAAGAGAFVQTTTAPLVAVGLSVLLTAAAFLADTAISSGKM